MSWMHEWFWRLKLFLLKLRARPTLLLFFVGYDKVVAVNILTGLTSLYFFETIFERSAGKKLKKLNYLNEAIVLLYARFQRLRRD